MHSLHGLLSGKARHEFCAMKYTRAQFQLVLRYCKQHEDRLRADLYADSLADEDYNKLWSHIRKTNNGKSTIGLQIMLDVAVARQKLQACGCNTLTSYVILLWG